MVEGTLTRTGAEDYSGTLMRTTRLLFCGAHGSGGEPCTLVLDGKGDVVVRGMVVADGERRSGRWLRLSWTPAAEHGAAVTGACNADFKTKVERLYLTARHAVEFPLPGPGAGLPSEQIEGYAWTVDLE